MKNIKIHVLHCGEVQVDKALPFHEETLNPVAYTGLFRSKENQIRLPVSAYLIEHPKGKVLIDTGWHTDIRGDQEKYLGKFHYMINKGFLPKGQAIDEQLLSMGISTKDIDYVVLTHLHSDHVSGLKLVKDAKNILVSKEELESANKDKLRYIHHMWEGIDFQTFQMKPSKYGPKNLSFDLFEDESIVFVSVPGHTKGLVATLIQNNNKFVLLTSDCGYAKKSWENMILPGVMINKEELIQSLRWEREMSKKSNCVEIIANHDRDVKHHSITL